MSLMTGAPARWETQGEFSCGDDAVPSTRSQRVRGRSFQRRLLMLTRASGLALLEASLLVVSLVTMLCLGIGLWDFANRTVEFREMVDRAITDSMVRPLSNRLTGSGEMSFEVDATAVETFLSDQVERLGRDIAERWGVSGDRYGVEGGYAVLEIDPTSGVVTGISESSFRVKRGAFWGDGRLRDAMSLSEGFRQLGLRRDGELSSLAIPAPEFGIRGDEAHYLPRVVLVGVRAVGDLRGSAAVWLRSLSSGSDVLSDIKVVTLRGEL